MESPESVDLEEFKKIFSTLKDMLEKKELTDVVLDCNGGEIEAHRIILSSRSSYFRRMFSSDIKESNIKKVDFHHVNKYIMETIIDYIYSTSIKKIVVEKFENLVKIFEVSQMFELDVLTKNCLTKISKEEINVDNCFTLWKMLQIYEDDKMVNQLLNFIVCNFEEVVKKEEFLHLRKSQLFTILQIARENNIQIEDEVLEKIIAWIKMRQETTEDVLEILINIDYNYISKECMENIIDKDFSGSSLMNQFFKLQIIPRLKSRVVSTLYNHSTLNNHLQRVVVEDNYFNLKIFFFKSYLSKVGSQGKLAWKVFDCRTKTFENHKILDFPFGNCFIPIQYESNIYFLQNKPPGITKPQDFVTFYSLCNGDRIDNCLHEEQSLLFGVTDPLMCIHQKEIYVINSPSNLCCRIQHYSVDNSTWNLMELSIPLVVACVSLKENLYLICKERNVYSLHVVTNNNMEKKLSVKFNCNIPITLSEAVHNYPNLVHSNLVCAYKDKVFIFILNDNSWYIFDPNTQTWEIKKCKFQLNESKSASYRCFVLADKSLMLYNEKQRKLYEFDKEETNLKTLMNIKNPGFYNGYLSEKRYDLINEKVLIYNEFCDE